MIAEGTVGGPETFVALAILVTSGWLLSPVLRALGRRIENSSRVRPLPLEDPERLKRIEQAVEAMAIEVERISEGQRFVTRLLSERSSVPDDTR